MKPCKRGHTAGRYANGNCRMCNRLGRDSAIEYARVKRWREQNPDKVKQQNNRYRCLPEPTRPEPQTCECCDKPEKTGRSLAIDHCHETGVFRGWLCTNCNTGLGKLGDNEEGLRKALAYLLERRGYGGI